MVDLRHEGRRLADDEDDDDDDQYERDVVVLCLATVLAPHLQSPAGAFPPSSVAVSLHPHHVGAATLRDPWDASPLTLELSGTERIWSPPTFATGCHFSLGMGSFPGPPC